MTKVTIASISTTFSLFNTNTSQINLNHLENYCALVENGYNLHGNPYHNAIHGADVLITTHNLISSTGFAAWMTDIEILALLFSAMIHDVEHTGTTNNFHICTR